ncbi:MAG TPA: discoidin domain-containing protein [Polyangiaceae bacterium]|nr:discoidin domain-containing protein [Polyangiaceae bacterium]
MNEPLRRFSKTGTRRTLHRAAYISATLLVYLAVTGCSSGEVPSAEEESAGEAQSQLQLSATATASSVNGTNTAALAVDGNTGTRWESTQGVDPQWLTLDLGSTKTFDRVYLSWEGAYGKTYKIQQSNDNVNFTDVFSTSTGDGGVDDLTGLSGNGRYVRMYGTQRGTQWGYSLYEMQVHQTATSCLSNNLTTSTSLVASATTGTASMAFDNNAGTRWESASADPQSLQVDLGAKKKVNRVVINWETARAKDYTIQVSDDGSNWTTLVTKTNMPAGTNVTDDLTGLNGAGRYVKMSGTTRTTGYGYSIWEMDVYGDDNPNCGGSSCTPTTCAALGANCGSPSDGCGGTLSCGTCGTGYTCNGSNQCVSSCTPTTCAALGATCGTPSNGCGGTLNCGTCSAGNTCNTSNQCVASGGSCTESDLTSATNLTTTASSGTSSLAFDNNTGTRWESAQGIDPQYIQVDLGASKYISRVNIDWEAANAKDYTVQVSSDGTNFSTVATKTNMPGGNHRIDDITGLTATGRYVRINGTARNLNYGYSIWEMNVYGDNNASCGSGSSASCGGTCTMGQNCVSNACVAGNNTTYYNSGKTLDPTPDFGSNVKVFTPADSAATIQSYIDGVYTAQHTSQFGLRRDAILFTPGTYSAHIPVGFNTQVSGLGDHPDAVNLTGYIEAPPDFLPNNNGTQTFWRIIENFKNSYTTQNMLWAVSQAAPMRRVHHTATVALHQGYGWESGGYIADSAIDSYLLLGSQQQWYTRNSTVGNAVEGTWNIMFQGVTGTKSEAAFPTGPMTDIANTPIIREKPFLFVDRDGKYNVFSPAIRTNAVGPTWTGTQTGTSIPLSQFYIAKAATDTAATMNAQLAAGKHLLLTPGIYYLSAPLAVNNANTIVLGMGLATLVPQGGVKAITVADVDGVKLAGILVDAYTTSSPVLVEVGPVGSSASHAANPTSLHDVFTRIGGGTWVGKAAVSLQINSKNTIIDHIWLWRADHSDTPGVVGWSINTAANGLVVNGSDVTAYGSFVEHFQQHEILWNGNNGKMFFLQNEKPYDAPSQAAYMNGSSYGYPSLKVDPAVTAFEGYATGTYAVFTMNACTTNADCSTGTCGTDLFCVAPAGGMMVDRSFELPDAQAGVKMRNLLALSLTNKGKINNLVNTNGMAANAADFGTYPKLAAYH